MKLIAQLEVFLVENGIEVAGIEYIHRPDGTSMIYDTNTNYNAGAEAAAGFKAGGMARIAQFLTNELDSLHDTQEFRKTA